MDFTGDWIPTDPCSKAGLSATWVGARDDVVETGLARRVEQWVQESKRRLSLGDEEVVEKGNYAREGLYENINGIAQLSRLSRRTGEEQLVPATDLTTRHVRVR